MLLMNLYCQNLSIPNLNICAPNIISKNRFATDSGHSGYLYFYSGH